MNPRIKEQAAFLTLQARKRMLEENLEIAAEEGDAYRFLELSDELDRVDIKILAQENYYYE